LDKTYPDIRLYSLEPERPVGTEETVGRALSLALRPFTSSPVCTNTPFVLRVGENELELDYYNKFVAAPSALIEEATAIWLMESGLFSAQRSVSSAGVGGMALGGHVVRLEGDFASSPPQAVIEIQYTMGPAKKSGDDALFFKTYRERVALPSSTPEALAQGWESALESILSQLESDIRAHTNGAQDKG
jgi:hypothetical protein